MKRIILWALAILGDVGIGFLLRVGGDAIGIEAPWWAWSVIFGGIWQTGYIIKTLVSIAAGAAHDFTVLGAAIECLRPVEPALSPAERVIAEREQNPQTCSACGSVLMTPGIRGAERA